MSMFKDKQFPREPGTIQAALDSDIKLGDCYFDYTKELCRDLAIEIAGFSLDRIMLRLFVTSFIRRWVRDNAPHVVFGFLGHLINSCIDALWENF